MNKYTESEVKSIKKQIRNRKQILKKVLQHEQKSLKQLQNTPNTDDKILNNKKYYISLIKETLQTLKSR